MSCDRCKDIHEGQLKGVNSDPCKCDCHGTGFSWYPNYTVSFTGADNTSATDSTLTTCSAGGCSTINLN